MTICSGQQIAGTARATKLEPVQAPDSQEWAAQEALMGHKKRGAADSTVRRAAEIRGCYVGLEM
jgi:hypothetical protein